MFKNVKVCFASEPGPAPTPAPTAAPTPAPTKAPTPAPKPDKEQIHLVIKSASPPHDGKKQYKAENVLDGSTVTDMDKGSGHCYVSKGKHPQMTFGLDEGAQKVGEINILLRSNGDPNNHS